MITFLYVTKISYFSANYNTILNKLLVLRNFLVWGRHPIKLQKKIRQSYEYQLLNDEKLNSDIFINFSMVRIFNYNYI